MPQVKALNLPFIIFAICLFLTLTGCGSAGADPLRVSLGLPDGESAETFWYGLEKKELVVRRGSRAHAVAWEAGATTNYDLKEGDTLTLTGYDSRGHARVRGTGRVGKEKTITIWMEPIL